MTEEVSSAIEAEIEALLNKDWANLLASREGRRIVWDILSRCGVFRSSYRGNADTNFLEGERNIGLSIINERIIPNGAQLFGEMMAEHAEWMDRLEYLSEETQDDG